MGLLERLTGAEEPTIPTLALWAAIHEHALGGGLLFPSVAAIADALDVATQLERGELAQLVAQVRAGGPSGSLALLANLLLAGTRNKARGAQNAVAFLPLAALGQRTGITPKPGSGGGERAERGPPG